MCKVLTKFLQWFQRSEIMVQIKDGCRQPYLSTDQNHFRADTTRPLGKHLKQVLKKITSGFGGEAITRKSLRTDR